MEKWQFTIPNWALDPSGLHFPVYGVFMVRQYMLQIPEELSEAARMTGGDMRICFQIIAPPLQAGAGNTGHSVLYMELE